MVLVKKDMLHFVQDVRAVRGIGRGNLDRDVVLCKVRFVRMLGRRCWELEKKMRGKGVWKSTKRKREG